MYILEEKVKRVIDLLNIPSEFGSNTETEECEAIYDMEYLLQKEVDEGICIKHGISKCAILIPDTNFVIKIPFNGSFYCEEDDCYKYSDYDTFNEFYYANDLNADAECYDYCENELIKYENAVDAGFGEFFAETYLCCEKDNTNIYLQEKIERTASSTFKEVSNKADDIYKTSDIMQKSGICKSWICACIDYYGEERTEEFLQYLKTNNLDLDLHSENLGYTKENKPILIDWAGWRD